MNKKITAIYGGSFNPPTIAHENIARTILKLEEVSKVVFLPVGDSYKKEDLISSNHRYNMLSVLKDKLKKENLNIELNTLEIDASKRLYTLESLRILKDYYKTEIAFIMGTDNIKEFKTWYQPVSLLEEFYFIVIERQEDNVSEIIQADSLLRNYKNKFLIVKENFYKQVSSTYIRKNIKNDLLIERYIDIDILNYIKANKLYGGIAK